MPVRHACDSGRMTESIEPNDPDGEFDEAARLATAALDFAHQYRSPPRPQALEIWHTYAAGADQALCARIDSELIRTPVIDPDTIEKIYEDHFLHRRLTNGISRIGEELDGGLQQAIGLIQGEIGSSRTYVASLRSAQEQMALGPRGGAARKALSSLISASRDHVDRTEAAAVELSRARAQVLSLQRELDALRNRAYLDHLTQIANRRRLEEVLAREIESARAGGTPLSFALGDIDHFKRLNDSFGHSVGDAVLKHFAALIENNIKGQDTPARYGGEEFAIIFPKTSIFGAGQAADNIRRLLYGTDFVLSRDRSSIGNVSVSFGVTQLLSSDTLSTLIRRADELLYRAKRLGRNRVETDG